MRQAKPLRGARAVDLLCYPKAQGPSVVLLCGSIIAPYLLLVGPLILVAAMCLELINYLQHCEGQRRVLAQVKH